MIAGRGDTRGLAHLAGEQTMSHVGAFLQGVFLGITGRARAMPVRAPDPVQTTIARAQDRVRTQYAARCAELDPAAEPLRHAVCQALQERQFDGMNPANIARKLHCRFPDTPRNVLQQTVTQEVALAQVHARRVNYLECGYRAFRVVSAPDCCPSCARAAAAGPHPIEAVGELPSYEHCDGHFCRCTILAVME
jgi:hypothetical protein